MFENFTSRQKHLNSNKASLVCSKHSLVLKPYFNLRKKKAFESYDESFIIFGLNSICN